MLEKFTKAYDYIEIRIKSSSKFKGNSTTNCRVHGIKIFTHAEGDEQLLSEIFLENKLVCNFPKLSNFKPIFLFRRAEILLRFVFLSFIHSKLPHLDGILILYCSLEFVHLTSHHKMR